jgi:FAD/FMN-containing dehydrogenase
MKATALKHLTVPILKSMLDLYSEYRTTVGDESMESICLLEVFPRDAINSVPDSGTAFSNRGEWFNITLLPTWEKPEHAAYTRNWVHSVVDKVAALEKEDEMTKTGEEVVAKKGYWNGSMGDEKSSLVFGENYKRLREVKRKYDPELVFRKWFPIAPADW